MKLLIDCGATKADWCLSDGQNRKLFRTPGFNLAQTPETVLQTILDDAALKCGPGVREVYLYAAGLVGEPGLNLGRWFPDARILYASDMLGAARAVCGREPGIAAIIGTGANTCQYDGQDIVRHVYSGGFILGDEGSASVLGRRFVADFLKDQMPAPLSEAFRQAFKLDYPTLVSHVYGGEAPARYLGSFAVFILSYYDKEEYVKALVDQNFKDFFERTLRHYDPLPVGVVGGFGYACRDILRELGAGYGIDFSTFLASPMEGLQEYHGL